jgi:carboxypeptidase-like protein/TonB-dependent receptor-like protein
MRKLIVFTLFLLTSLTSFSQKTEVRGKVTNVTNNEPVAFANVIIKGTQIGATTDIDGNFVITGANPGYIIIQVYYVGYKPALSADVLVVNNNVPFVEISMEPEYQKLDEVVVKADPFERLVEAPLSMQSIRVKEIENNPGSNRDISRVIQSFPGVGSTPAFRNDVIIRGGGPGENRFFLDGIEIPVLNHFATQGASGGPVGIINADFIQSVDFYSGSFQANKYNALSGILDFKQKEGSKDKTNFQITVGASEAAFTVDGPLGNKTDYIFSIRRSYLQFLFSAIGLPFLPTFNDYQLKVKTDFNTKNRLTIVSLGSLDKLKLNTDINNPDESQEFILTQTPINNQWSYTIGAVYNHFFNNGFHTLVVSRNMMDNEFYKYPDNDESKNKNFNFHSTEAENKFRYELSFRKKGVKYNFSVGTETAKYFNSTYQKLFITDSLINLNYTTNLNLLKYGISAQASKTIINSRLLVTFGFRVDGNSYNKNMSNPLNQFSPRLSLSYNLTEKTFLNIGTGRYFQMPAYTTLGFRNNNNVLVNEDVAKFIGVMHYNIGIEHRFVKPIILSFEIFYKDYFQYPIDVLTGSSLANQGADYSSVAGDAPITSSGKGRATGFEVLNRINLDRFTLLAAYTYVRSLFTNIEGDYISSSWDNRHLLTITASRELNKNWRAGLKWRFAGGLPYTPYDMETSALVEAWDAKGQPYLNYSELNEFRFEPFHQLDIRIDKNFFFKKWALMLYLDIQNVYNFKNTGQDYIIRKKNPDGTYKTINGGTEYLLKSVPNTSGTILPTVGIMIKL